MRPLVLRMYNFMSYEEEVLDLSRIRLGAIIGPNGSGKSTILQAITYALWGVTRMVSHNDVVKRGAPGCSVSLDFVAESGLYRVTRRRTLSSRGTSDLEFARLGDGEPVPLTCASIRDTQEEINSVLGISYDAFSNSVLLQQGQAGLFSDARPAARKELLGSMLGIDSLEEISRKARALARENNAELKAVGLSITGDERELEEIGDPERDLGAAYLRIEEIKDELFATGNQHEQMRGLAAEKERVLSKIQSEKRMLSHYEMEINKAVDELNRTNEKIRAIHDELDSAPHYEAVKRKYDALRQSDRIMGQSKMVGVQASVARREIERERELLEAAIADMERDLDRREALEKERYKIAEKYSGLLDRFTPDELEAVMHLGEIDAALESLNELPLELAFHQKKVEEENFAHEERKRLAELLDGVPEYDEDEHRAVAEEIKFIEESGDLEALARVDQYDAMAMDLVESAGRLAEEIGATTGMMNISKAEIALLEGDLEDIPGNIGLKLDALDGEIEILNMSLQEWVSKSAVAKRNIGLRDKVANRLAESKDVFAMLANKGEVAQLLAEATSKTGAQALIIEIALPQIEADANRFLAEMSPGTSVMLESQRETTTGKTRETLDVLVYKDGMVAPIETLSGGERFRADLALRSAIGLMLTRTSGTIPRMVAIDEGFGSQDADGREGVLELCGTLSDIFDLVLVITHLPDVAETIATAGHLIRISKNASSKIEVIHG